MSRAAGRVRPSRGARVVACSVLFAGGCAFATDPAAEVADVRGTWTYSGEQAAPALVLTGTLSISAQQGEVLSGQLSWQEPDGSGGTANRGGAVSGRVIETTDVDFDVLVPGVTRRHVGRLVGDSIKGAWIETASGKSGAFVAVRGTP